ncbi:MAG: lamin tail domain-containing protein, partial [Clostridia bacterium]|nr:lamin tail domain-containing protein [Clostridia bacterium]
MKKIISLVLFIALVLPTAFSSFTIPAFAEPDPDGAEPTVYDGVVFSRVSGNGGKKDAACKYSFIELYNTTDSDISLSGLAVYYKEPGAEQYTEYALSGGVIAAGGYYLVRGAAAKKYEAVNEIISVNEKDEEWDLTISNKEFSLVLAPAGLTLDASLPLYDLEGITSYLCLYDSSKEYFFDSGYEDDFSKNKFAVRTALREDSGWYTVNLNK